MRRDGWIVPDSNPVNRIIILWPFCKPQIPRSEYIVTVESCSVHSVQLVPFGCIWSIGLIWSYSVHFVPFYADWSISVHSVLLGLFRSHSVLLGLFGPFRPMVFFRVLANKNKQQPNQILPRHPKKKGRRSLSLFVCSENPGKYKRKLKDKKESFVIFSLYYYYYFSFKTTWNESDKLFSRWKVDCMFLVTKSYFIFNNLLWFQNFDFELDLLHYFYFFIHLKFFQETNKGYLYNRLVILLI